MLILNKLLNQPKSKAAIISCLWSLPSPSLSTKASNYSLWLSSPESLPHTSSKNFLASLASKYPFSSLSYSFQISSTSS